MQIVVAHKLEVFATDDGHPSDAAPLVFAICEPVTAAMGETVTQFLVRAGWRFDLPTICLINGECYGRAEWPDRALAVNDNVEFVSRPLGSGSGGSTIKSIASVVALVALTAVAGPTGFIGSALATSLGSALGAVAGAAIVGAGAIPLAAWMVPRLSWWRRTLGSARDSLRHVLAVACHFWSPCR